MVPERKEVRKLDTGSEIRRGFQLRNEETVGTVKAGIGKPKSRHVEDRHSGEAEPGIREVELVFDIIVHDA